jgi:hypothetical protein
MQYKTCLLVFPYGGIKDKILYKAVLSDLLRKHKINCGSTITIIQAKTTLAQVCKATETVELFVVGTKLKSEPSPWEALQL